jgi:hypothetical protein
MKIKKIILSGLWIFILLFIFGGTPQKLLVDNMVTQGPQTSHNCINLEDASILVPYINGCPKNQGHNRAFPNPTCQAPGKNPDISGQSVNIISGSPGGSGSSNPNCHMNARKTIVNPYWYIFQWGESVDCWCYDFSDPAGNPTYACTAAQLANPPASC